MLCDVVTIDILNEVMRATVEFLEKGGPGMLITMLQHPLNDSAAILVLRKMQDLSLDFIDDELDMLSWDSFNSFLYDVVSVLVGDGIIYILV